MRCRDFVRCSIAERTMDARELRSFLCSVLAEQIGYFIVTLCRSNGYRHFAHC